MLDERFWTKVDKSAPNGCWEWQANKNKGYGLFRPGGIAPKRAAHRLAYEDAHGAIPKGAVIRHECDNPSCVNPAHLIAGSHKDNTQDMVSRGRNRRILNEAQVISLRRDYVAGLSVPKICKRYGISPNAIHDFTGGRSWTHILGLFDSPTLDELKAESARRTRNNARINSDTAKAIKRRLASGELGKDLATEYGIHKATISDIKLGKIWKD